MRNWLLAAIVGGMAMSTAAEPEHSPSAPPQYQGVVMARPAGCTTPERRQLDFWLGNWDISPTGQSIVIGEATITSLDQGCATLEDFHLFTGLEGHGLFGYDPVSNKWRQSYIDARGGYSTAQGGVQDGVMTFDFVEPPLPPGTRRRVHIQSVDADTVRLWAEQQAAITGAWSPLFDLTYRRRPGPR